MKTSGLLLGLAGCLYFVFFMKMDGTAVDHPAKINGVSLVNPPYVIDSAQMADVKRINTGWVAVIPFAFSRKNEPGVHYDHQRQWWGERLDGTAELIGLAHKNNLKVMLKPHVWLRGQWIGDFDLDTAEKWTVWEAAYRDYILAYARLADSLDVALFCVGTELKVAAANRPGFWKSLIREVRLNYKGKLTYAANWDNYEHISFWKELDYIGIDSYFPLVADPDPDQALLGAAWKPIENRLEAFSSKHNLPILFTEYGYQSLNGAAGNHWEVEKSAEALNPRLQAKAYECMYRCLWDKPWFAGGFLWKWHFRPDAGGPEDGSFTPQGKPAEEVIANRYKTKSPGTD